MKLKIAGYLFVSIVLVSVFTRCGGAGKSGTTMTVRKGTFEIVIPAAGELQAVKSTPIRVPPRVRRQTLSWMAPENSYVKEGETVVRMDAGYYKERIKREVNHIARLNLEIGEKEKALLKEKKDVEGTLTVTEIEKEMAERYSARDAEIYSRREIVEDTINMKYIKTKTEHYRKKKVKLEDKARAELQLLELKRKTHQVKLKQYRDALESLEIKAPHDGLFIHHKNRRGESPRVGMQVWRGMRLGQLPDLSLMEAKVYVLESEAAGLKPGLSVSVTLESSPGVVFPGKVSGIDSIAKPIERESPLKYFEIKVSLGRTDAVLMKPGSRVKAQVFVEKREDVISVPNQAFFFKDGLAFVNLLKGSGLEKREVKIGVRSLTRTVVMEGLSEGERVVLGNPGDSQRGGK